MDWLLLYWAVGVLVERTGLVVLEFDAGWLTKRRPYPYW